MTYNDFTNDLEKIHIEHKSNGSENWVAVSVRGVRVNSKVGKELIEAGFRNDSYYGLIYTITGNLKEKTEKAGRLAAKLQADGFRVMVYDRAL